MSKFIIKSIDSIKFISGDHEEILKQIISDYKKVSEKEFKNFIKKNKELIVKIDTKNWYPHSDTLIIYKWYKDKYGNALAYKIASSYNYTEEDILMINPKLVDMTKLEKRLIKNEFKFVKGGEILSEFKDIKPLIIESNAETVCRSGGNSKFEKPWNIRFR